MPEQHENEAPNARGQGSLTHQMAGAAVLAVVVLLVAWSVARYAELEKQADRLAASGQYRPQDVALLTYSQAVARGQTGVAPPPGPSTPDEALQELVERLGEVPGVTSPEIPFEPSDPFQPEEPDEDNGDSDGSNPSDETWTLTYTAADEAFAVTDVNGEAPTSQPPRVEVPGGATIQVANASGFPCAVWLYQDGEPVKLPDSGLEVLDGWDGLLPEQDLNGVRLGSFRAPTKPGEIVLGCEPFQPVNGEEPPAHENFIVETQAG